MVLRVDLKEALAGVEGAAQIVLTNGVGGDDLQRTCDLGDRGGVEAFRAKRASGLGVGEGRVGRSELITDGFKARAVIGFDPHRLVEVPELSPEQLEAASDLDVIGSPVEASDAKGVEIAEALLHGLDSLYGLAV